MKDYKAIHRELVNRIELLRGMAEEYGEENVALFHCWRGKRTETLHHVTLRIDNSQHRADEVVRRVIDYADCMIEELSQIEDYWSEAHFRGFWEYMDRFIFVVDGERAECNVRELTQGDTSSDIRKDEPIRRLPAKELEAKRAQWAALRERFLQGERLEVEHLYISEQVPGIGWSDGLPSLLSDLLEGGRLADCVTLQLVEDANDPFDPNSRNAGECQAQRYMWINGLLRGEYVCGEVPFVRDDGLIRSVGSWRQSCPTDDLYSDEGITLYLAPSTDPALLARAKACALKLKSELGAQLEYTLSKDDSFYGEEFPSHELTNEQSVRLWLERFGQIRAHFTDEEARQMLACAVPVQELFTRHSEGKYAPEEIELYRFGISVWTLLDVQEKLRKNTQGAPATAGLRLEWPEALQQKASALPEELRRGPGLSDGHGIFLVGMGDLSSAEGANVMGLSMDGAYIKIFDIRLNGLDDVRRAEALFNELADILREAQEKYHEPSLPKLPSEEWCLHRSLYSALQGDELFLTYCESCSDEDLKRVLTRNSIDFEGVKTVTDRECLAFIQSAGKDWGEANCFDPQEITFEAQDTGVNARLRFRLEDGRFIHEVAVLE